MSSHAATQRHARPGAAQLGAHRPMRPARTSRSRTCRSPPSAAPAAARRSAAAWRSATRCSTWARCMRWRRSTGRPRAGARRLRARRALNALMGAGRRRPQRRCARRCRRRCARAPPQAQRCAALLVPQSAAEYRVAADIGDYTDFYTSIHHATAVGRLFRPDNPLLPNYKWVPIGYHGRASSIARLGPARSPPARAAACPPGAARPELGPDAAPRLRARARRLRRRGQRARQRACRSREAEEHVFGLCLLNDWSARDIQAWEYQPLGPVPRQELRHHDLAVGRDARGARAVSRAAGRARPASPQPLPYLDVAGDARRAARSTSSSRSGSRRARMRAAGAPPQRLSHSQLPRRLLDASRRCSRTTPSTAATCSPGDLLGSGTQSGPRPEQAGSLLELTAGRQAAARAAERRDAHLPRGRRSR